jgi:hypothetical protein
MPYPGYHSCRIKSPGAFQTNSFRNITRGEGANQVQLIIGKLKGKTTTTTQAIRYPVGKWTELKARTDCKGKGGTFEAALKATTAEAAERIKKAKERLKR